MDQLATLQEAFGPVLAIKRYRLHLTGFPDVPIIPCLDHEAMLHQRVAPHAAAYVQDRLSGDLHEVVIVPDTSRIDVDVVSTWGETSPESHQRLLGVLRERFPNHQAHVKGPSWWRGEQRVAEACRAQVTLRDVLLGEDFEATRADIDRLQTISTLMEKESRVASWGVRTVTGPLLAAAGVVTFAVLGSLSGQISSDGITIFRYLLLAIIGGAFLYYGLKAVQLTGMANRAWKRAAEYALILNERKRIRAGSR